MTKVYHEYREWDGTHEGVENILEWIGSLHSRDVDITDLRLDGRCDCFHRFCCTMEFNGVTMHAGDRIVWREFTGWYMLKNPGILDFDEPEDSFTIAGRGTCYSSSKWKLPEGFWEPWDLAGYQARICGTEVKIRGVDAFASPRSPSSPYSHPFALMVSDEDAEKIGPKWW